MPEQRDPYKVTTRPVRAGDPISVEVEGGFRRHPAPSDGIVVETAERAMFVPIDDLEARLAELGRTTIKIEADVDLTEREVPPGKVRILKRNGGRP